MSHLLHSVSGSANPDEYSIESESDALSQAEDVVSKMSELSASDSLVEYQVFIDELGKAVVDGKLSESEADSTIRILAEGDGPFKFKRLEEMLSDAVNEHSSSPSKMRFNIWLEHHVEEVVIQQSTDHNVETTVKWVFDTGDVLETQDTHYSWSDFMTEVNKTNHEFVFYEPEDYVKGGQEWKVEFMMPFLNHHGEVVKVEGSRTQALEELQNTIRTRKAFDEVSEAYQGSVVYVEDEDFDEVYVLSRIVSTVAEEYSVTLRALQSELDSRGVIEGKASEIIRLDNGQTARCWNLPSSFAEPEIPDSINGGDDGVSASRGGNE